MEVTHKQFDLSGFLPDPAPDTLRSGAISGGYNLYPSIRGWSKIAGFRETVVEPTNERNYLYHWSPTQGDNRWFSCGNTSIQQIEGNTVTDVSRVAGYSLDGAHKWKAVNFNGVLVMNNVEDAPQYLAAGGVFADLPNIGTSVRFRDIGSFGAYLIGVAPNLGSGFLDDEIYWSHPADPGTVPPNWDYANPASDSGITPLPSEGYCVTSVVLSNLNIIYKSDSIWVMRFIGGQYVFSVENKFPGQGILNKYCVETFEGNHFVVAQNDIIIHDGYKLRSIADKKLREFFFADINPQFIDRAFVVKNPRSNTIIIYYPSQNSGDGYCDKALSWNWRDDSWSPLLISPLSFAAYGYEITGTEETWEANVDEWEQIGAWQTDSDIVNFVPAMHYAFASNTKLLAPSVSGLFVNEPIEAVWERTAIVLGRLSRDGVPYQNYEQMKVVNQLCFDMDGSDTFEVYLGFQQNLNDSVSWEYIGDVDPKVDKRIHCLFTTGFLSVRLKTKSTTFQLRAITIHFELAGEMY